MASEHVLPLLIRVDKGVMATKGFSKLDRSPELEPCYSNAV